MKIFADVSSLAASTLTADQIVKVKSVGEYRVQNSGSGITLANGRVAVPVASGTSVNVLQFGADPTGVNDSTAEIQAAIAAVEAGLGGTVFIPAGSYLVTGLTISDSIKIKGAGRGFGDDKGTILEKPEGTNNGSPIIQVGNNTSSIPFFEIEDLTIIGDTTDASEKGIYVYTVGAHGLVMRNLHVSYVQGIPIHINNTSSASRAEFVSFENISVGMDFEGYNGRSAAASRSISATCTGIQVQGYCDEVNISNCVLLGTAVNFNAGVHASDCDGDVLRISNSGINGSLYGVHTKMREFIGNGVYTEGNNFSYIFKNNVASDTLGCKTFSLDGCFFASSDYLIWANDDATDFQKATKGAVTNSFIYSNFTSAANGIDVVYETGVESVVLLNNLTTHMSNEGATVTGCRAIRTAATNAGTRVVGQRSLFREANFNRLENPEIHGDDSASSLNWRLRLNATGATDNGLQFKDSTDTTVATLLTQAGTGNGTSSLFVNVKDAGTHYFKQVKMGANDSGGAGYRLLRIDNI